MKEFIMAAFPWVCIGLVVAVLAAQMSRKKKAGDEQEKAGQQGSSPDIQEETEDSEENYMTTGMCLGMCFWRGHRHGTGSAGFGHQPGDADWYVCRNEYEEIMRGKEMRNTF